MRDFYDSLQRMINNYQGSFDEAAIDIMTDLFLYLASSGMSNDAIEDCIQAAKEHYNHESKQHE